MKVLLVPALLCLVGIGIKSAMAQVAPPIAPAPVTWNDRTMVLVPESARAFTSEKKIFIDFPDEKTQLKHAPKSPPDENMVKDAYGWISSKALQPAWVIPGITDHWIPMKGWADGTDAFVVRYVVNGHNVQLMYTRLTTTVIVSPLTEKTLPVNAHAQYLKDVALQVLLIPATSSIMCKTEGNITMGFLRTSETKQNSLDQNITHVSMLTNGRFVAMFIGRSYGPPPATIIKQNDIPLFDQPAEQPVEQTTTAPAPAASNEPPQIMKPAGE